MNPPTHLPIMAAFAALISVTGARGVCQVAASAGGARVAALRLASSALVAVVVVPAVALAASAADWRWLLLATASRWA